MSIIDDAKSVVDLIRKSGNIDLQQKIVDLQGQIVELVQERNEFKNEVAQLKEASVFKESLFFEQNVYWVNKANKKDGPYCPVCWDTKKLAVRLQVNKDGGYDTYYCGACKEHVHRETYPDTLPRHAIMDEY